MLGAMLGAFPVARAHGRSEDPLKMQLERRELRLSIEPGSDPIAGRIGPPGGAQTPFEGYMQLVAALEELRGGEDRAPDVNRKRRKT
jgi:hypothetical protein